MSTEDQIYRNLQIHLDKETLGFPTTPSGSDIRLLKSLFPPDQAEMVTLLTHRFESLDEIKPRAEKMGKSMEEVERVLELAASRGMIGPKEVEGVKKYRLIPLFIGFGEAGSFHGTPEFRDAIQEYLTDGPYWQAFLTSAVPQMRTIPIDQSVSEERRIASYDEVRHIIETTADPIAVLPCVCRVAAAKNGNPCKATSRENTCMLFHEKAVHAVNLGPGQEVSKEEALEILRKNGEEGLVLQPSNTEVPNFICSCCGCCCGLLQLQKAVPNPVDYWATNFQAAVDVDLCTGCGDCVERCPVNAMQFEDEKTIAFVDLTRCLGCGVCTTDCPVDAISLHNREKQTVPPMDTEELFEVIVTQKASSPH